VRRGRKPGISASTPAAVSDGECLPWRCKIHKLLACFGVANHRSHGHRHFYAFSLAASAVAALAVSASLGSMFRVVPEVKQRVVVFARYENDIAAPSAVSAARAASRNKLLAPERKAAVTAVAGFYRY
jgi:hypothetical protein